MKRKNIKRRRVPLNAKLLKAPTDLQGHPIWSLGYQSSCIDLNFQSQPLDPAFKAPRASVTPTIRLLENDLVVYPTMLCHYNKLQFPGRRPKTQ